MNGCFEISNNIRAVFFFKVTGAELGWRMMSDKVKYLEAKFKKDDMLHPYQVISL